MDGRLPQKAPTPGAAPAAAGGANRGDGARAHTEPGASREDGPGLLARVAASASRLASDIATSSGMAALDPALLAEAKSGEPQESRASASREWTAGNNGSSATTAAALATQPLGLGAAGSSGAPASFRRAARTAPGQGGGLPADALRPHAQGGRQETASSAVPVASHQVSLAQSLDGRGVAEFLEQSTPASMSTGDAGAFPAGPRLPARQHGPQAAGAVEATDPVAYLHGSTYAADMERGDHREPRSTQGGAVPAALQASPASIARGWDEHGASVLEEWQLNEAWDRAWMDTAWSSARAREKAAEDPAAAPVPPSHRNLSYLLKPRI
ncbi:hypothetical protein LPJ61_000505 [Coemansia biformis]|uniref:Uncharacterized protein n=1 Tax=Coemansia biformis TaxID=1286918 RepID=A0A9W7YG38_9FUNG|nr:hypothetical protein LPJ61_000505 [Coemansia biformis]